MASIHAYTSEKILSEVKMAKKLLRYLGAPLIGGIIKKMLLKKVTPFEAKVISKEEAADFILSANSCAIGQRFCRKLHPHSKLTESVFLDDLAQGLIRSGHARPCTKPEAIETLHKYNTPIILSKVSGRYAEICHSVPKECVYWQFEKNQLKCMIKK